MTHLYGEFDAAQFEQFKTKLHNKLFWLLLYKDPKTCESYKNVDFKKYFTNLMREIDGLNELLFYPEPLVEICCKLQAAYRESCQNNFEYSVYRKFVLDAHGLIDKIGADAV